MNRLPEQWFRGLRRRGVDVLTVPEAGTLGVSDAEQALRKALAHEPLAKIPEGEIRVKIYDVNQG